MMMLNNSSNSSTGKGNTSPSPKQISPAKKWIFVLNNYTEDELSSISSIVPQFCDKWIYAREVGGQGTPHIQGFFNLKKKARPSSIFQNKRIHFEKANGSLLDQVKYCSKEGDVVSQQGMPKLKREVKLINPDRPYQKQILDIVSKEPDDRTIYWFFDRKGGIGKTSLTKYLVMKNGAIILGGKSADVRNGIVDYFNKNGDTPELIVYNVPRSLDKSYLSYESIENCKDMVFYSGKYEGAMICGNAPHLIIFANEPPYFEKLSEDRWSVWEIDCESYVAFEYLGN